jgi:hypothetical protein
MAARVDCHEFELGGDGENGRLVLCISFVLISGVGRLNSKMGVEWLVGSGEYRLNAENGRESEMICAVTGSDSS